MDNFKSGDDGFVSIEVDPLMCDDTKATIQEGRRLYKEINKPNLMIKIPATKAGYEATRVLMSEGINVNSTLIFSNSQSQSVCEAMQEGMNEAALKGFKPKGVVSIFVSRFDKKADDKLNKSELKSKLGILNATYIYNNIQKFGNKNIKALFASTGVKSDDLPTEYYVKELLYPNSINTAPLNTIEAFVKSGIKNKAKILSNDEIEKKFKEIEDRGVDIKRVQDELLEEGLEAFKEAFRDILSSLE
jgi:transaldolase